MTITEASRHHMLAAFQSLVGEDAAMTLAEHLPPVGWADVATKADVSLTARELRGEMDRLRAEMAQLRAELHADMAALEVRITDKLAAQSRLLVISIVSTLFTIVGSAVAIGALLLAQG